MGGLAGPDAGTVASAGAVAPPPLGRSDVALAAADRTGVQALAPGSYPALATTEAAGSADAGAPPTPDVDLLARQVYALIKQRLVVERERLGASRGPLGW